MILRLLFILFLLYIMKYFINKMNYKDYFFISLLIMFLLFSYMFVMYENSILAVLIVFISLIIYLFRKPKTIDNNLIILDGKINFYNMIKSNYSLDNLREDLNDIKIKRIPCGILKDGKLFCYFDNSYYKGFPISIIFNGLINYDGLKTINKTYKWMTKIIEERRLDFDDIFYAFYYRNSFYIIKK